MATLSNEVLLGTCIRLMLYIVTIMHTVWIVVLLLIRLLVKETF